VKALKKAQLKEMNELSGNADAAFQDLDEACIVFNEAKGDEAKEKAKRAVEEHIKAFNDQILEINDFMGGIASEIREYIDGKSEKWQESDKATDYEAWAEAWEEELDTLTWEMLDAEGVMDVSDIENPSETLGNLSTEVEG
jgi:hypothetical protein